MKTCLTLVLLLLLVACGDDGDRAALEEARATFLEGNAAYEASVEFERMAEAGDQEAFKAAVMRAEDALAYWQRAAATRLDWPAARRNVERALLRVESLRERKKEGTQKREPKKKDEPKEDPPDQKKKPTEGRKVEMRELPAGQVLTVLDRLAKRERAKQKLRRAQRARQGARVERDW